MTAVFAGATEGGTAGRLLQRYANTIVVIKLTATTQMSLTERPVPPRVTKADANGVIVSPSGLTVTALSALDPRTALLTVQTHGEPANRSRMAIHTEFDAIRIEYPGGREVAARLVEEDSELDLAFFLPVESEASLPYVDFARAAEPRVLGSYFVLARASRALRRTPTIRPTSLTGILDASRRVFLMTMQQPGTAIYDETGRVLGLTTEFLADELQSGYVVIPAADLAERIARIRSPVVAHP